MRTAQPWTANRHNRALCGTQLAQQARGARACSIQPIRGAVATARHAHWRLNCRPKRFNNWILPWLPHRVVWRLRVTLPIRLLETLKNWGSLREVTAYTPTASRHLTLNKLIPTLETHLGWLRLWKLWVDFCIPESIQYASSRGGSSSSLSY